MKKRIVIVHGWDGGSDKDWMPWATEALRARGYDVVCPSFPHPENPTMEDWVPFLASRVGKPDRNTYLIGHSIGCQTIIRYLETIGAPVGGVIFVAGWFDLQNLEGPEAEDIARPWIERPIDLAKVRANLPKSVAILSDNDPFVPYDEARRDFAEKLGSEVVTMTSAGHVTSDDGHGPFPLLVETFEANFK
ncbi:MAG: alpha/beta fold hydrolase [Candidatus Paceibacterota bacterium]|jgi:hypothetical protein